MLWAVKWAAGATLPPVEPVKPTKGKTPPRKKARSAAAAATPQQAPAVQPDTHQARQLIRACLEAHKAPAALQPADVRLAEDPSTFPPSQGHAAGRQEQHQTSSRSAVLAILLQALQHAGCVSQRLVEAAPQLLQLSHIPAGPSPAPPHQQQPASSTSHPGQGTSPDLAAAQKQQRALLALHHRPVIPGTDDLQDQASLPGTGQQQAHGMGQPGSDTAAPGSLTACSLPSPSPHHLSAPGSAQGGPAKQMASGPGPAVGAAAEQVRHRWSTVQPWRPCSLGALPSEHSPQGRLPDFTAPAAALGCVSDRNCEAGYHDSSAFVMEVV